jgi:tetratricopeptide (TPR) repeat protein
MAHFDQRAYDKARADVRVCQRIGGSVPPEFLAALERTAAKSAGGTRAAGLRLSLTEEEQSLLRQRGTLNTAAYDAFTEGRRATSSQSQMEQFNRAIELDGDFAQAYAARAELRLKDRAYGRAIEDFNRAVALCPDDTVLVGRGNAHQAAGDYDQAIRDFNRAIAVNPGNAQAHYCRGLACGMKGDASQAMKDHSRAIELKPDFADAYQQRAMLRYDQRALDDAWADIQMCRKLGGAVQPDFLAALSRARGGAATDRPQPRNAEETALDPQTSASWFGRAAKLNSEKTAPAAAPPSGVNSQDQAAVDKAASARDLNDQMKRDLLKGALDDANRAIELRPDSAEAHRVRGVVLTRMGDYDGAIRSLDRAIELNPKLAVAYFNRAQACYGRRSYDEAWASVRVCQQLGQKVDPAFTSSLARASGRPE